MAWVRVPAPWFSFSVSYTSIVFLSLAAYSSTRYACFQLSLIFCSSSSVRSFHPHIPIALSPPLFPIILHYPRVEQIYPLNNLFTPACLFSRTKRIALSYVQSIIFIIEDRDGARTVDGILFANAAGNRDSLGNVCSVEELLRGVGMLFQRVISDKFFSRAQLSRDNARFRKYLK